MQDTDMKEKQAAAEAEQEAKQTAENTEAEAAEEPKKLKIRKRPELINETQPLWTKHPNECTKEEYLEWKLNWPQTADGCGRYEPKKKWRKE